MIRELLIPPCQYGGTAGLFDNGSERPISTSLDFPIESRNLAGSPRRGWMARTSRGGPPRRRGALTPELSVIPYVWQRPHRRAIDRTCSYENSGSGSRGSPRYRSFWRSHCCAVRADSGLEFHSRYRSSSSSTHASRFSARQASARAQHVRSFAMKLQRLVLDGATFIHTGSRRYRDAESVRSSRTSRSHRQRPRPICAPNIAAIPRVSFLSHSCCRRDAEFRSSTIRRCPGRSVPQRASVRRCMIEPSSVCQGTSPTEHGPRASSPTHHSPRPQPSSDHPRTAIWHPKVRPLHIATIDAAKIAGYLIAADRFIVIPEDHRSDLMPRSACLLLAVTAMRHRCPDQGASHNLLSGSESVLSYALRARRTCAVLRRALHSLAPMRPCRLCVSDRRSLRDEARSKVVRFAQCDLTHPQPTDPAMPTTIEQVARAGLATASLYLEGDLKKPDLRQTALPASRAVRRIGSDLSIRDFKSLAEAISPQIARSY